LLKAKLDDPEFLVRSFVSRASWTQQTADSFAALLQIMKFDNTPYFSENLLIELLKIVLCHFS
jgi:hypothetical protein